MNQELQLTPPPASGLYRGWYGSAEISDCGLYRYTLRRWLEPEGPSLLWAMLNPSDADGIEDDPTIRAVIDFTIAAGFRRLVVANLFALRSPKPDVLRQAVDPIGPRNDDYLSALVVECSAVVCAWGTNKATRLGERGPFVAQQMEKFVAMRLCLGTTADGSPRHPLYVPRSESLQPWPGYSFRVADVDALEVQ